MGGWRGLFDAYSCEFKMGQEDDSPSKELMCEKWDCVKLLMEFLECKFDGLVYLVAKNFNTSDNYYMLDSIPMAVYQYARYFREAEDYLMRCHHPLFKHFQSFQSKELHWHLVLNPVRQGVVFEDIESLILDSKLPD
jgi:hypothetical protein